MTLSKVTVSITIKRMTLSIISCCITTLDTECPYAGCHIFCAMLSVVMLSGVKFTVIFLSVIMPSVIILSVIMLSVVILIVVAPLARAFSRAELVSANQQKRVLINFIIQLVACTIKT